MSNAGRRLTLEQRIALRDSGNTRMGKESGWQEVALDLYLEGEDVGDICELCNTVRGRFYDGIAKAALYRLMKQANCERLEDMENLHQ